MRYESSGESSVNGGGGATKIAAWCRRQEHAKGKVHTAVEVEQTRGDISASQEQKGRVIA